MAGVYDALYMPVLRDDTAEFSALFCLNTVQPAVILVKLPAVRFAVRVKVYFFVL